MVMKIINSTSTSPTFNLASEEYLFYESQDDILFFYVNEPSVIIGCNQAIQNEIDLDYCRVNNIHIVRRMSGGGAVYHDLGNLNYCFISNKTEEKYSLSDEFLLPIVDVLTDLVVPVEIGKRNDLWLERKYKISGTASHMAKNRELHHGTLLYDTNLEILERTLNSKTKDKSLKSIASVQSPVKNLSTYFKETGHLTFDFLDFFDSFKKRLVDILIPEIESNLLDFEREKIQILVEKKYASKDWTFRK